MEGVADRDASSKHIVGMKDVGVIEDVVVVNLRANEDLAPDRVTQSCARMDQKVIAVDVGDATGGVIASGVSSVKENTLSTGTGGKDCLASIADARSVQDIHVIQDRAVLLEVIVKSLLGSKGGLHAITEAILENAIQADVGVGSAFFGWRQVNLRSRGVFGGNERAGANREVKLLSMGESGEYNKGTHGRQQRELSQIILFSFRAVLGLGRCPDGKASSEPTKVRVKNLERGSQSSQVPTFAA